MIEHTLLGLSGILVIGIFAQWLAWRTHIPAILLLLLFGLGVGPFTGLLVPDQLFGDLLLPIVSLSVALILFEGGLSLKISELKTIGREVRNLVTIGALAAWGMTAVLAYIVLNFSIALSLLTGAILVVTGPTVVIPLLRQIRTKGVSSAILKWEGIVIDPLGVLLAVLVFEGILAGSFSGITVLVISGVLKTLLVGVGLGFVVSIFLIVLLKFYLIPDYLQNPIALALVIASFTASNMIQHEAGLMTVTIMGIVLANQSIVSVKHITQFKEDLRVLLIASLFIMLSARIELESVQALGWPAAVFIAALILIVRPVSVFISTYKSKLTFKEKIFLSSVAPRGIVAAAMSSLLSIELINNGQPEAEQLVPIIFVVIISTVTIYGIGARVMAKVLGLSMPNPQGAIILGAHSWAREIAIAIRELGHDVILVDSNGYNIAAAKKLGLKTHHTNISLDYDLGSMTLDTSGKIIALTANDEVNTLATLHFTEFFGRAEVYQLATNASLEADGKHSSHHARTLFADSANFNYIGKLFSTGGKIKSVEITKEYPYEKFQEDYSDVCLKLFMVYKNGSYTPYTVDSVLNPVPGNKIIILFNPEDEKS